MSAVWASMVHQMDSYWTFLIKSYQLRCLQFLQVISTDENIQLAAKFLLYSTMYKTDL